MDIFVCIKQVPSTNKVQVDEKTGVLKRSGIQSKMNPYDLYALETALRLKALHGGTVTVGTMGPPQAQAIIREAYMMGADDGYVFSDRRLGGADVLAITDSEASPLSSIAGTALLAKSDMVSFIDSLVAPLSLVNALIVAIGRRMDKDLSTTFEELEKIWAEYGVYENAGQA